MNQQQMTKAKRVPRIDECVAEYERQQHDDRMRKARKAVRRARVLTSEAERFLALSAED